MPFVDGYPICGTSRFNPLNQVYVFNEDPSNTELLSYWHESFNPLNQVYVFNKRPRLGRFGKLFERVLIP